MRRTGLSNEKTHENDAVNPVPNEGKQREKNAREELSREVMAGTWRLGIRESRRPKLHVKSLRSTITTYACWDEGRNRRKEQGRKGDGRN